MRAVHALAADPGVAEIGLLDRSPPPTWANARRIGSVDGWDVVLAPDGEALEIAAAGRVPAVTPADPEIEHRIPITSQASPAGLAKALAEAFGLGDARLVVTTPGRPVRRGPVAGFPEPIGVVHTLDGDDSECAPVEGQWAGVLAEGSGRTITVVDDAGFLDAVCLAAGIACLTQVPGVHPVWERAVPYLAMARGMGLVMAESVTPRS
jgi:hypothetical protein